MAKEGTVLVVGPHDIPRKGMERILESGGYEVLSASDGNTGGELIKERSESLSLVIIEPGMTEGIDNRPIVGAAYNYGIPLVRLTFADFVLDPDAKKGEVLTFVSEKARQIEEK